MIGEINMAHENVILGIDIGCSTTKIAAYSDVGALIATLRVVASDRLTSLYGAIGNLLSSHDIPLSSVKQMVLTGVGATYIEGDIYGIPTTRVSEFDAIGIGGLALRDKGSALVVSMGTGTAFVRATKDRIEHIGGSGVGGGTLLGLAWHLFHETDYEDLAKLADSGTLENIDLVVSDICKDCETPLPSHVTASNFGRLGTDATKEDLSLGIINMVFQTIGMLSAFALRNDDIKDVVLIGALASLPHGRQILDAIEEISDVRFFVPDEAPFGTAIGAALPYTKA